LLSLGGAESIRLRVSWKSVEVAFMSEKFIHARALVKRAKLHEGKLKKSLIDFKKSYTPRGFIDEESQPGVRLYKINIKEIPVEISCIVFDIINELRSALDHAVYRAVQIITSTENPENTKFPFGKTRKEAAGRFKKEVKSIPDDFKDFLLAFKPYESGNKPLWGLNNIRNTKIHRLLRGTAYARDGFVIRGNGQTGTLSFVSEWDAANNELTVARQIGGYGLDLEFTFDVAFEEGTAFANKTILKTLKDLISITEGVVVGIESETLRLNRIIGQISH